jgi:hypothetical protein
LPEVFPAGVHSVERFMDFQVSLDVPDARRDRSRIAIN